MEIEKYKTENAENGKIIDKEWLSRDGGGSGGSGGSGGGDDDDTKYKNVVNKKKGV